MSRAFTLFIGGAAAAVGNIVSSMIAARFLTQHDYATFRQTFLLYEILAPIFMMGLPLAIYVLISKNGDKTRATIVNAIAVLSLSSLIVCVLIYAISIFDLLKFIDNPKLDEAIVWMMLYAIGMLPAAIFVPVMVSLGKTRTATIYNVIFSLTMSVGVALSVVLTISHQLPVAVRAVVPLVFLPVVLVLLFRESSGPLAAPSVKSMVGMARFSLPLGVATMLGSITVQMHTAVVAALCSPEEFAIYANGAAELPLVGIVTGSIMSVLLADMSLATSRGDYSEAVKLFRQAAVTSASILLPCMFFFMVTSVEFIVIMYSEKYVESALPFVIYLGILPARIIVYGAAMTALGMNREILFRSAVDLALNLGITWALVYWFGYVGAAVGLLVTLYLWTIPFNMLSISRKIGISWRDLVPWKALGTISVICAISAGVVQLWRWQVPLITPWGFFVSGLLYAAMVLPLLLRLRYLPLPFAHWLSLGRTRRAG